MKWILWQATVIAVKEKGNHGFDHSVPEFFFADINEWKAGKLSCAANANCQNTFEDIIRCFILDFIYFISFAYYIIIIKKKTKNN